MFFQCNSVSNCQLKIDYKIYFTLIVLSDCIYKYILFEIKVEESYFAINIFYKYHMHVYTLIELDQCFITISFRFLYKIFSSLCQYKHISSYSKCPYTFSRFRSCWPFIHATHGAFLVADIYSSETKTSGCY